MTTLQESRHAGRLERRKARTRAAILRAAEHLFSQQGYDATSIAEIAELADTGVGTVYGYFESKADVLREVLVDHSKIAVARYEEAVHEQTPHIERICAALNGYADYLSENRIMLRTAFGVISEPAEAGGAALIRAFGSLIRDGIAAGELRELPVSTTAHVLVSIYTLAFLGLGPWSDRREDPALRSELEEIVRATLQAI